MPARADLIPDAFRSRVAGRPADADGGIDGNAWLASLPRLLDECLSTWKAQPDGPAAFGECALVVPVRVGKERAALKVTWPHAEARHEHLALRAWRSTGAVRMRAADPARWALLLERCEPAVRLHEMSALDACETIGLIHARLTHPALPQLDTASAWCARIRERLESSPPPMPRRFVQQGIALARDLPQSERIDATLVHSDLHDDNVMQTRRAGTVDGFVAIDPKPLAGEPALAVAPLLWNRWDEAAGAYNLRNHLRFRVDYACDPMGVAPERARAWSILRLLDNAWWDAHAALRPRAAAPDLTKAVSIIKAMQG